MDAERSSPCRCPSPPRCAPLALDEGSGDGQTEPDARGVGRNGPRGHGRSAERAGRAPRAPLRVRCRRPPRPPRPWATVTTVLTRPPVRRELHGIVENVGERELHRATAADSPRTSGGRATSSPTLAAPGLPPDDLDGGPDDLPTGMASGSSGSSRASMRASLSSFVGQPLEALDLVRDTSVASPVLSCRSRAAQRHLELRPQADNGERSSCEASAVNRRWASKLRSSRPSISFRVSTSRPISSAVPGCGRRSERFASPMCRARACTIWSIGTEGLPRQQRAGHADPDEDDDGHAEEEPASRPRHRVRVVQRHGHLDGASARADLDRQSTPSGSAPQQSPRPFQRPSRRRAQAREEARRRRQARPAERSAARDDLTVQVRDLHELVEPHERRRVRSRRDVVDADGLGGIRLERRRFRRSEPEDRVVDDISENRSTERPVRAERRERQHDREHRHVSQPEAGLEAEGSHASVD